MAARMHAPQGRLWSRNPAIVLVAVLFGHLGSACAVAKDGGVTLAGVAADLDRFAEAMRLRLPPRNAHVRFLREVREVPASRLVEASARLLAVGELKQAAAFAERAAARLRDPLDLSIPPAKRLQLWATSRFYAGRASMALGDMARARQAFHDTQVLTTALLRIEPADRTVEQLATADEIDLASLELAAGTPAAAMAHYRHARDLLEGLVAAQPAEREPQQTLAATDRAIGELKLRTEDTVGALASLRASQQREAMLIARDPQDAAAQLGQAQAAIGIADVLFAGKDVEGARAAYARANQLLGDNRSPAASSLAWRYTLAESMAGLAGVAESRGDLAAAAERYRNARDDFLAIVPLSNATDPLRALGSTDFHLATVAAQLKDTAGAIDAFRDAIDAFTGLLSRTPGDLDAQRRIVATFGRLAELQAGSGDSRAALESFGEARDIIVRLSQLQPGNIQLRRDRAIGDFQIAKLLTAQGDFSRAATALRDSIGQLQSLLAASPDDPALRRSIWTVAGSLGTLFERRGELAGALAAYRLGAEVLSKVQNGGAKDAAVRQALAVSAERISSVGYMMILAHDYRAALEAQDAALTLVPGTPWIEANRAHALMLLGRTAEARAIYLAHRDAKFPRNVAWADGTHKDFDDMRKAGAAAPLMDEIEKDLSGGKTR